MTKTCVNCGEEVKQTDIFCPFCGANADKLASDKQSEDEFSEQNSAYCSKCNAKNKPEAQFCEYCGNELAADSYKATHQSHRSPGTDRFTAQDHAYGSSYTTEPTDEENRKWYTPPKRTRSAKHPAEWFFWTCWGIFIVFRAIFQLLWFIIRIGSCIARAK